MKATAEEIRAMSDTELLAHLRHLPEQDEITPLRARVTELDAENSSLLNRAVHSESMEDEWRELALQRGKRIAELEAIPEGWRVHSLKLDAVAAERDRLIAEVENLLRSAIPHPTHHPKMHAAWKRAQAALSALGHPIPDQCLN